MTIHRSGFKAPDRAEACLPMVWIKARADPPSPFFRGFGGTNAKAEHTREYVSIFR